MRIISGERKGHSIFSFKSKDVRPLSDKNRETIFNLLTHGKELVKINFSLEEAKVIALRAVKAAIVRNIGTGDGINVAIMDKDGFRLLTEEQKKAVIEL